MITNFEELTNPLRSEERESLPYVIDLLKSLKTFTSSNSIMYDLHIILQKNDKKTLSALQFRKVVNHLRSEAILPIIATKKGYIVSWDKEVLMTQIRSLHDRSNAIMKASRGLETILKQLG